MRKSHLTFKIFALIVLNDVIDTIAQLIMKRGLVDTGISSVNLDNIIEFAVRNTSSVMVWLGVIIYMLNFFVWIIILYRMDLSIAMPVGSTSYIFVPIAAVIFLHEHVSPIRWLGIACIVLGIHFVSQSKKIPREAA
jgi:drug/metabolite transporter (DMT)-like permease